MISCVDIATATRLSITGHMYFVPRTYMDGVDVFEGFLTLPRGFNKNGVPLIVNSFYIIDDEKQHYEQELRRELDGMDDEFSSRQFMS